MSDTIAGRYTLIDPIARGGSGTVWRAWDQRRRKLCAAKVLRQRDSADLLRFVREQSVKLEHPHVLAPYGWAAEDEHVVIAMDLCDGGTLETVLQDHGALSEPVIEEIMLQLLRALQFVHAEGWIHRDVKPANLMMNATGTGRPLARLADFGIATQVEDARLTRIGTVVGTPGYIAPELLDGAEPDPAQDLFAAGVVAMRMVRPVEDRGFTPTPETALEAFGEDSLLGAEIAALLDADTAVRHDGALALQERLAGESEKRIFEPARTREGESLEIFQTLDPLPDEWQEVVDGIRNAARQPSTGAVTAARSGDSGEPAGVRTARTPPEVDLPSGGWIRTNYGLVATPAPGGEPLLGPAVGPAGAVLHGMPSGLTGDGGVVAAAAPPVEGSTTGAVVQGPLPQGQDSRATLLGGPVVSTHGPGRVVPSEVSVLDPATGTTAGVGDAARAPSTPGTAPASGHGPLARLGLHGPVGWLVVAVAALMLAATVGFGILALTDNTPAPDPAPTATTAPTETNAPSTSGSPGGQQNFGGDPPTIGSGFEGVGPGRVGE